MQIELTTTHLIISLCVIVPLLLIWACKKAKLDVGDVACISIGLVVFSAIILGILTLISNCRHEYLKHDEMKYVTTYEVIRKAKANVAEWKLGQIGQSELVKQLVK